MPIPLAVPDPAAILINSEYELFAILVKRDGTKVCFPYDMIQKYLGWTDD